ncbi:MAG: DUF7305 domain-containing protein [bacterium]
MFKISSIKRFDKDNNGYLLVSVFIILLILLAVGTVILNITLAEYKQAERDKNKIKAYYLARSGAELTADSIINGDLDLEENTFNLMEDDGRTIANININSIDGSNDFIIESESAEVNGVKEIVKLKLENKSIFDSALFAVGNIQLQNQTVVIGDVESKGSIKDNGKIEGNIIQSSDREMPSIDHWPDENQSPFDNKRSIPTTNVNGKGKGNSGSLEISESGYYEDIAIKNNETLRIDTTGKDNLKVLVDNFDIKGTIDIVGDGDVSFYAKDGKQIQTPNVEIENDIYIYLQDEIEFTIIANSDFNGFIHAPEGTIELQSSGTKVNGSIIAKNIKGKGNNVMGTIEYKSSSIDDLQILVKGSWGR